MKVIFLDIDGVLNSKPYRESPEVNYYDNFISADNMCFLERIVKETECKIVLCSEWRAYWNRGKLQFDNAGAYINRVFEGYELKIYDKTPELDSRDEEITAYLQENPAENFVIIDDYDFDWSDNNVGHVVKTCDEYGLNEETAEEVIRILQGDYSEMEAVDEEWSEVRKILFSQTGESFEEMNAAGYYPDSKVLFLSCDVSFKAASEQNEKYAEALDESIRTVFGDDVKYFYESEKGGYDPFAEYNKYPDVKTDKIRKSLTEILKKTPERIFKSGNVHSELLFSLLMDVTNTATDYIRVSRSDNKITVYVKDAELLVNKAVTDKMLFRNCDYEQCFMVGESKKRRYLPALIFKRQAEKAFYANIDEWFLFFALVNMRKEVTLTTVKENRYSRVTYIDGTNNSGVENGETDRNNGVYISYTAPSESELSNDEICNIIERISLLSGVKVNFFDPEKGDCLTYSYRNAGEYLDKHNGEVEFRSFSAEVKGEGKDRYTDSCAYNAKIDVAFRFSRGKGTSEIYYNYSLLPRDNVLVNAVHMEIAEKLNTLLEGKTEIRFTEKDVKENGTLVVLVNTDDDCGVWKSVKTQSVASRRMLNDMASDALEGFLHWLIQSGKDNPLNDVFDMLKAKEE